MATTTAAAAPAVNTFLSYDDMDEGNPPAFPPLAFNPVREPGVHFEGPLLRNKMTRAVDFFHLFFTAEMVNSIVVHTNSYAYVKIADGTYTSYTQSDGSWKDTTPDEINRLMALLIYFGLVKVCGDVSKYWSTKTLFHGLWARAIMSRLRFLALMAVLHVVDPVAEEAGQKLSKVESFIDYFKSRCLCLYQPRQNVAIDERMVKSRHRSGIRQYIKDKPTKWGIKLWVLADSLNACVIDFDIYIGKASGRQVSEHGLAYDVVMKLINPFFNQGYHLFIDNFYTSITLAKHLFQRGILTTGTILDTKRDFPPNLKNGKQWAKGRARGSMRWERVPPVLTVQWIDNKVVSLITTSGKANETVQVNRKTRNGGVWSTKVVSQPKVFQTYNRHMNAVDRADQVLATNNVQRKCMRWWKALFFHLIDIAVANSYILFKEHQTKFPENEALRRSSSYSLGNFREELVRQLCGFPEETDVPPANCTVKPATRLGKFDTVHVPVYGERKRSCVVCCRLERKQRKVYSYCSAPECEGKYMHITKERNCFEIFHTREYHGLQ